MDVIDDAIAVVVDAVAWHLVGIDPHVGGEVGMVVVDAGVDHADDDLVRADGGVPRLDGIDVGIGGPAGLPGVVQPVQLREARVLGRRERVHRVIALCVLDRRIRAQRRERILGRGALRQLDQRELAAGEVREGIVDAVSVTIQHRAAEPRDARRTALHRRCLAGAKPHQDRVRDVVAESAGSATASGAGSPCSGPGPPHATMRPNTSGATRI